VTVTTAAQLLSPLHHFPTEFGKIRVSLLHANGVTKNSITEDYQVLGILAVFFRLETREEMIMLKH
jgi:hypothetical protein